MSKVARARMDGGLKEEAEAVLDSIGITPSEAIRMFYRQIVNRKGFPLELKIPNETTMSAFEEGDGDPDELETLTTTLRASL
ncbi:MAG: type II toxin-antitoxin system antitoxin, RelB/DinJ family [Gammaproteobacteria bacterium]|nr:MAG: type II toxin-antitoxin system antitoxin, RelB/DinJ family [Gammaproteobacteria bacterium]